jgi:hypothetical protein
VRPYLKNEEKHKGWGVAQVVDYLPSKHKTLSLISSTAGSKNVFGTNQQIPCCMRSSLQRTISSEEGAPGNQMLSTAQDLSGYVQEGQTPKGWLIR